MYVLSYIYSIFVAMGVVQKVLYTYTKDGKLRQYNVSMSSTVQHWSSGDSRWFYKNIWKYNTVVKHNMY